MPHAPTYEAAFAVLVVTTEASGRDRAFVVVTMLTGLGTSLYYPLTGWLENQLGWRTTLLVLAASLALIALPAHLWTLPGRAWPGPRSSPTSSGSPTSPASSP